MISVEVDCFWFYAEVMANTLQQQIRSLPASERYAILLDVWESLEWMPIPDAMMPQQLREVIRRAERADQDPATMRPGVEVIDRLRREFGA